MLLLSVCLLVGCGSSLETSYKPKKLGVSDDERRGYYAPEFTPEAVARDVAREAETK